MLRARLARQLALLVFAALCPGLAFALKETYEGVLQPDGREPAIPIVVVLQDVSTFLKGNVKTSSPLKGEAPIESGSHNYGRCTINVTLSKTTFLRLYGSCDQASYIGVYTLWDTTKKLKTDGSFRLTRKVPEPVKVESKPSTTGAANSAAACLKANTRCLVSCPRGDDSAEFMCANHCRAKLRTCKAQSKKPLLEESE
jgi:hypothetical protein